MPELPEVEFARQCLQAWAQGQRVAAVAVHERRVVTGSLTRLQGARFQGFDRRGKNLCLTLRKGKQAVGLWSHLGMTGKWLRRGKAEAAPRFCRVEIALSGGTRLCYVDMRLFGHLCLVPGGAFDRIAALAALGPDALAGVDVARLHQRLGRSKQPIKVALMDQGVLAGLGNIQVSEALFRARLDPQRPARSLTDAELTRLARAIAASLAYTLARFARDVGGGKRAPTQRSDIRYVEEPGGLNPFRVYGRAGEACPRRHRPPVAIVRLVQGGRSTFFCPHCQK